VITRAAGGVSGRTVIFGCWATTMRKDSRGRRAYKVIDASQHGCRAVVRTVSIWTHESTGADSATESARELSAVPPIRCQGFGSQPRGAWSRNPVGATTGSGSRLARILRLEIRNDASATRSSSAEWR